MAPHVGEGFLAFAIITLPALWVGPAFLDNTKPLLDRSSTVQSAQLPRPYTNPLQPSPLTKTAPAIIAS